MSNQITRKQFLNRSGLATLAAVGHGVLAPKAAARAPRPSDGPPRADIRPYNGAPTLFINDTPHSAFSYITFYPDKRIYKQFGDAGVNLYTSISSADSVHEWGNKEVWVGPDEFDYSGEDAVFDAILSGCPDAFIFPRVHALGPNWWMKEHPEELVVWADLEGNTHPLDIIGKQFRMPSWASEKGLQILEEGIHRFVEHCRTSPYANHMIGYHIGSWPYGEWMAICMDASKPMMDRWQKFLEQKYRTNDALRKAWGDPEVTFDTIQPLSQLAVNRPPEQSFYKLPDEQRWVDYHANYEEVLAEATIRLAKAAKEASHYEGVVGSMCGYLFQHAGQAAFHGHSGMRKIVTSPYLDFLSSPTMYARRELDNGWSQFMGLPETVRLHGKMWWDENDYRTYLSTPQGKSLDATIVNQWTQEERDAFWAPQRHWKHWGGMDNLRDSIEQQKRQLINQLTRAAGQWWFDMDPAWFDDPTFMKALGQMDDIAKRALHVDRTNTNEIAVVIDAGSMKYSPQSANIARLLILEQSYCLGRIGAPVSFYLLDDIEKAPDHKLWVFLNAFSPSKEDRERIARKVKRNGSVVAWLPMAGYLQNGNPDLAGAGALTGIRMNQFAGPSPATIAIGEAAHPITEGLFQTSYGSDAATGDELRHNDWLGKTWDWNNDSEWTQMFERGLVAPTVFPDDPGAEVLGYMTGVPRPGLVVKNFADWTSVYSAGGPLSPALLRNLARLSDVHLFIETQDNVYACKSFVGICPNKGGKRTVRLTERADVVNVFTDDIVARNTKQLTVNLEERSSNLYYIGNARDWRRAKNEWSNG